MTNALRSPQLLSCPKAHKQSGKLSVFHQIAEVKSAERGGVGRLRAALSFTFLCGLHLLPLHGVPAASGKIPDSADIADPSPFLPEVGTAPVLPRISPPS